MKKIIPIVAIMATVAFSGAANAEYVGNKATVDANVTIGSQNVTAGQWVQDSSFTGVGMSYNQRIGVVNITATGPHTSIDVAAKNGKYGNGLAEIPFYNTSNNKVGFWGTADSSAGWNQKQSGLDGLPGWGKASTGASDSLPIKVSTPGNVSPGVYKATFYIQQWNS